MRVAVTSDRTTIIPSSRPPSRLQLPAGPATSPSLLAANNRNAFSRAAGLHTRAGHDDGSGLGTSSHRASNAFSVDPAPMKPSADFHPHDFHRKRRLEGSSVVDTGHSLSLSYDPIRWQSDHLPRRSSACCIDQTHLVLPDPVSNPPTQGQEPFLDLDSALLRRVGPWLGGSRPELCRPGQLLRVAVVGAQDVSRAGHRIHMAQNLLPLELRAPLTFADGLWPVPCLGLLIMARSGVRPAAGRSAASASRLNSTLSFDHPSLVSTAPHAPPRWRPRVPLSGVASCARPTPLPTKVSSRWYSPVDAANMT